MPKQAEMVGKYEIIERIARGGMGAVYKAKHPTLKRFVILKQLTLRAGTGIISRFRREAALMIDFRDEHIVPVYDHFKHGSSYYIVMEYVDGTSLDRVIEERGQLSIPAVILIFSEICRGLKYAHDKGVVHRDIKPANILISKEGEVKLTDFGIATTKEADEDGLTHPGMTLGTPAYMSPEQISSPREVDKRADIYSMGVMLYEMFTGKRPFPSSFTPQTIDLINRGACVKPLRLNPAMPRMFRHVIRRSMHRKKQKRYRDLQSLLDILSRFTRKYKDQRAIHDEIRRYVSGAEIALPGRIAAGKRARKLLPGLVAFALGAIVLAAGLLFMYSKGYYHEYFRAKEYGKLEVIASIPSTYFKGVRQVYAVAELKRQPDTEAAEPRKKEINLTCRLEPQGENLLSRARSMLRTKRAQSPEVERSLATKALFLPAGNYNLVLWLENQKLYRSLYLNPRVVQKQSIETYEGEIARFAMPEPDPKPVFITHSISDASSGKSLYGKTDILFFRKDTQSWEDWKLYSRDPRLRELLAQLLKSGERYSFQYLAPSYYPERIVIDVERSMDAVRIEVSLMRKPGILLMESNHEGLEILIDNRRESYIGGKTKAFISYGHTVLGEKSFMMPEGNYMLTLRKDSRHVANAQFRVEPEQTTRLIVFYDEEKKDIRITR